jgi:hypothetical protein
MMKKIACLLNNPTRTVRGTIKLFFIGVAAAYSLLCLAVPASAINLVVDDLGELMDINQGNGICATTIGTCTLRAAIMEINANADASNTITFSGSLSLPGTIYPSADLPVINRNFSITGPGSDLLTVDGQLVRRIFRFQSSPTVVIEGLTLARGATDYGGAVYQSGGSLTLREVVVRDSVATEDGGGVRCQGCTLTVERSLISGNTSSKSGGGIYVISGSASVTDTLIMNNTVSDYSWSGGGVHINGGPLFLYDDVIENNSAGHGGGVYMVLTDGNAATISYSMITGNTAFQTYGSGGGVVYNAGTGGGKLLMHSVTLTGNKADWGGGLSANAIDGYALVVNSTISGNTAPIGGSGIRNGSSVVQLSNATITGNTGATAAVEGSGDFVAENSVIAANTRTDPGGPDCNATITSAGYNLLGDNTGCTFVTVAGDQWGTGGSPLDPHLGPLAWNGGPTSTHLPVKNVSISSSLIEQGNPAGCTWDNDMDGGSTSEVALLLDQRLFTRLYDADGGGARCDIGAVEWSFCDDGIQNNGETGVDCGGGGCGQCACLAADRAQTWAVTYATMQAAYDAAIDGRLIKVLADATPGDTFTADRNIYGRYSMGESCDRLRNTGTTMLNGPVSIEKGSFVLVAGAMSIH